jgi:hemerythrin
MDPYFTSEALENLHIPILGDAVLDKQHRELECLLFKLPKDVTYIGIAECLATFLKLWYIHTKTEQVFMDRVSFSGKDRHTMHHSMISNYIVSILVLINTKHPNLAQILDPLVDMLSDHFQNFDRMLIGYNQHHMRKCDRRAKPKWEGGDRRSGTDRRLCAICSPD